ncbi:MAG: glycerophosphodiester phosphodiesterase [Candidatus Lokiarchaeota archaeon]|nr:glycerophosphodiester phosphodiesterase [Candidatus Lokiarchaeota archaeon]
MRAKSLSNYRFRKSKSRRLMANNVQRVTIMTDNPLRKTDRPLIMGHRGDPKAAPENTLEAIKAAVDIGVDYIETDIRLTGDGQIVLFHDDTMERLTGEADVLLNYSLEDLLGFDMGEHYTLDGETFPFKGQGYKIATLEKALTTFPKTKFNLDIKDEIDEFPQMLIDLLTRLGAKKRVIVGSFHTKQIERMRGLASDIKTAASPREVKRFVLGMVAHMERFLPKNPRYFALQVPKDSGRIEVVTQRFVDAAHERNIAVHVWTINDEETMGELIDMDVDGIFTDEPKLLIDILTERGLFD